MDDLNALAEYGSEVNSDDEEYRLVIEQALKESEEQKKREDEETKLVKEVMQLSALEQNKAKGTLDMSKLKRNKEENNVP